MSRLSSGGFIDRSRIVKFSFDGKSYSGHPGDTLASALIANDVKLVGRSFKYHRPRGILTAGSEEPNALVSLRKGARHEPNTRATMVELFDGLEAFPQNVTPSLSFDVMAVNQLISRFIGAGFYYKTFMWPASFWEKLYEPIVRGSAGLGTTPNVPDPDHYEKASAFCDVLVIGAGPTGLMAALTAARSGARVILADEDYLIGGRLNSEKVTIGDRDGAQFSAAVAAELVAMPNVKVMSRTTVFGVYDDSYGAVERVSDHLAVPAPYQPRQRLWRIAAKHTVLAAGAIDRPIVFDGNDRPGIMLAQGVQTYINRFAAAPARRMAFFTSSDGAWVAAFDAADAGVEIAAIVDARRTVADRLLAEARRRNIRTLLGGAVTAAHGSPLKSVDVVADGKRERLAVDGLAMSGGYSPNVQLACHHRGRPQWHPEIGALLATDPPPRMKLAGAANGSYALSACLADGAAQGAEAAVAAGFAAKTVALPRCQDDPVEVQAYWHVKDTAHFAFVDFQTDVSVKDIEIAAKEGFIPVEHLKRYTALGMGADQGKLSNFNGLAIMADITGRSIPEAGTTIYRPPYTPVSMGALTGHHRAKDFRPTRLTPTHFWAKRLGAKFVETGMWLRAQYFPRPGDKDWLATVQREVTAVRSSVGMIDVSTFGKIDLQGPDVGKLLDRVYVNTYSTLPVGKARYGVMLREDGMVMDDGTTAHLSDDHWVMTTTTVNAVKVFSHLEFCLQVLWPDLDVRMASISEQWAQIALAGPNARKVLEKIVDDPAAVANEALPVMGAKEAKLMGGIAGRVFRLSFSGELGFEVAVPARHGEKLAEAMMAAGKEFGITPYGTEALAMMRIEKGHVSGPELNGQTTVADLGLGKMASKKKDYIGRVLFERPDLTDENRLGYVGIVPVDKRNVLRAGTHLMPLGAAVAVANDHGFVSSATQSPTFGHAVGVGFLAGGAKRIGEKMRAYDPLRGGDFEVEICSPYFYDPQGERTRV
jgi:methylglutamate dehydrogenase subunit C